MSIGTLITLAPSPIIPVTDVSIVDFRISEGSETDWLCIFQELIRVPENAPKEQQRKIAAYNELLEVIYTHKIELESLEGDLADMKADIEGEMEYIALKDVGGTGLEAQKSGSGTAATAALIRSGSPMRTEEVNALEETGSNTVANVAVMITNRKNVASITKSTKSRGKGKGKQEKAKLNGMNFKYHRVSVTTTMLIEMKRRDTVEEEVKRLESTIRQF